jgi:hypothetical protein
MRDSLTETEKRASQIHSQYEFKSIKRNVFTDRWIGRDTGGVVHEVRNWSEQSIDLTEQPPHLGLRTNVLHKLHVRARRDLRRRLPRLRPRDGFEHS